ncbi:MAG TPA: SpoIIE family protein phosphatase, partial [Streptosporangiaceae bacterium]|nr:SpoIIE family protein phosphatase [Streptosporangiaceae bacterium]
GLLLYTDGLIEDRHRDLSDGLATLAAAIRRRTPVTAQQICDAAEGVLGEAPGRADDVCLLAVRLRDRA